MGAIAVRIATQFRYNVFLVSATVSLEMKSSLEITLLFLNNTFTRPLFGRYLKPKLSAFSVTKK